MISRLTLLLLLLCKDISWKPGGSCCAAPPSLQRYQPLCFLFCFFFPFSIRFCFFPLCHCSSPLFSLLKNSPCLFTLFLFSLLFLHPFLSKKKIPLSLSFGFFSSFSSAFGQYL